MGKNTMQVHSQVTPPIVKKFKDMGARVKLETGNRFVVDVRRDKKGEYFNIWSREDTDLQVLDLKSKDRHLLLMAKVPDEHPHFPPNVIKVLCGHDEREWFSSQVERSATNVDTAKQALKPDLVIDSQITHGVKTKNKHRRKNKGFIRQGEWFFIPTYGLTVPEDEILKKEPLILSGVRAGNKPHIAELAFRRGGEQVYIPNVGWNRLFDTKISRDTRNMLQAGLTNEERSAFMKTNPSAKEWGWRPMVRNPELYVKGYVRHPDHKTIIIPDWYRVVVNGEIRGQNVVFLD